MTSRRYLLYMLVVTMYLFNCHSCCNLENFTEFNESEVDGVIQESFKCSNIPSMAVAVVRDGKILLSRGYGTFGVDNNQPVSSSSVFGVASLTKVMTSTLFIKLLQENTNLTINSPIKKLLQDQFKMADEFRTSEATFADLLSHRMGIPDHNMLRFNTNFTRQTLIDHLQYLLSPDEFRVKYYYSNIMYGLVTRMTEMLGGKKWEELLTENLLRPLNMSSSTFASVADFTRADIVIPYDDLNSKLTQVNPHFNRRWAELAGSGSFMTTAEDMGKWMNFHLSGGRNAEGHQIINTKVIAEVNQPKFYVSEELCKEIAPPLFPQSCSDNIFCSGLRSGHYRGYHRLTHTGSTRGYRAVLSLLTGPKIGIFIALTGRDDHFKYRNPLLMYLTDRALGLKSWLNISTICSYPEPWKKSSPASSQNQDTNHSLHFNYQQYEGTYFNSVFGYLDVIYNQSTSLLEMSYGWGKWALKPMSAGASQNFYAQGLEVNEVYSIKPLMFLHDAEGTIHAINATGFLTAMPPIFNKITESYNNSASKPFISMTQLLLSIISIRAMLILMAKNAF
ncbi:hypothetical protein Btru_060454 [Bulinus truncatus]|nr:hypothetical protein Btru_060454 [Bulinus truncatus]